MGDRAAWRRTRTLSTAKPRPISGQVGSGVAKLSCDRSSDTLNEALLQGFALGAGPVGFARRRRRAGRQWVGASSSRDGSLPMR